ncbi:hypothetical protein KIW84_042482 [Lathyrus oleraceus]|uniref:Uncharacterized protein n=1 Tax=Pisum sativum TaxID=3888 RepID=A0A9D4XEK6_PEA|nr:hypothetical protein KIW84_042482 [Pisum sativum]
MRNPKTSASRKGKPSKVSTSSPPSMTARNVKTLELSTIVKKPQSMTSLYLDPISVEPNVGISKDRPVLTNVMEDVETSKTSDKPRSVTTLSKSNVIVEDRDDVYKNIHVLISQVLGIEPKIDVVPDVSTSLAQPDNTTETLMDKSDVNVSTLSPEKLKDKERSEGMTGDLDNKDKNSIEKKDQPTDMVNIEDLDSDDVPIGQILAPCISKILKNRKCQAIESSSTPSKSIRKRASGGPKKRWSKFVTHVSKKKSLKRKEVSSEYRKHVPNIVMTSGHTPSRPTNRTCILVEQKDTCKTLDETIKSCTERKSKIEMLIKVLCKEEGSLKGDGIDEEEENEEGSNASDNENATNSDKD